MKIVGKILKILGCILLALVLIVAIALGVFTVRGGAGYVAVAASCFMCEFFS